MVYGDQYGDHHRQSHAVARQSQRLAGDVSAYNRADAVERPTARHAASTYPEQQVGALNAATVASTIRPRTWRGEWPLLADDMFRLAHRDRDGSSLLDSHTAGLTLSAALLGELLLVGHLTVEDGLVRVVNFTAPSDVLAHTVLDQVTAERLNHPVSTWLAYLSHRAYVEVAGRMERAGHIEAQASWRFFGRSVRYMPRDMNAAAWPWARLAGLLHRGTPLSNFDLLLGGLAVATDLHRAVLVGEADAFAAALSPLVARAPYAVRTFICYSHAAAGAAVITKT